MQLYFLPQNLALSSGIGDSDYEKMKKILEVVPSITYICLDVANGYSEYFVSFLRKVRKEYPNHTILVCVCVKF